MSNERQSWNERWSDKDFSDGWQADSWLLQQRCLLNGSSALDVACGRGRNALFLAEQGFSVTALDYSAVALRQLTEKAAERGVTITTLETDLENSPQLPQQQFDLVINFFYLYRPLLLRLREQVKPGGLIMIRTFTSAGHGEPCRLEPKMVLEPGELLQVFADWEILVHEEGLEPSKKGGTLVGLLARKPA